MLRNSNIHRMCQGIYLSGLTTWAHNPTAQQKTLSVTIMRAIRRWVSRHRPNRVSYLNRATAHIYLCYFGRILSAAEVQRIRAEIQTLEQARNQCIDSGIQKTIDGWIEGQKENLAQDTQPAS
jgi:hypothetical protein